MRAFAWAPLDVEVLEAPHDPELIALFALWRRKRGSRLVPARADIEPAEFKRLLPNIILLDLLPPPDIYRVRLAGETINQFYGRPIGGLKAQEYLAPDAVETFTVIFRAMQQNRLPVFRKGRVHWWPDKSYKQFESCMLPLGADGSSVDMVLTALKFGFD